MTKEPGHEVTDEEWAVIMAARPKRALTAAEQDDLLEMRAWFVKKREEMEDSRKRWETWRARFPLIFTAIGSVMTVATFAYNVWVKKGP